MIIRFKEGFLYLLGILILAFGITLMVNANLGSAPWDLLSITISKETHLKVGTSSIVIQVVVLILTKIIFKTRLQIFSLVPAVLQGIFINYFLPITKNSVISPYVLLIGGCFISAIGISIYPFQGFSSNPIDNFTLEIHRCTKANLAKAKIISDVIPLMIVIILGSVPHFTTIIVYLMVPFFLNIIIRLKKILKEIKGLF